MGSSKTANAIMVRYNYMERGQKALMLKPAMERRDGEKQVRSRSGLTAPCAYVEELDSIDLGQYDCLIVDEAQFLTKEQVKQLVDIVDERDLPVICYGLRADFKGDLFPGSLWLMAWADAIEEVKTVCWCGRKATCNARIVDGKVAREGEQVVLGGNENYVSLCRKHWRQGNLFEGSHWLLAGADTIEEIKTVCWCGREATCNARAVPQALAAGQSGPAADPPDSRRQAPVYDAAAPGRPGRGHAGPVSGPGGYVRAL